MATIETLTTRIENATAKLEKKENTIAKKQKLIEKKFAELVKMGYKDGDAIAELMERRGADDLTENEWHAIWKRTEIDMVYNDIERAEQEIAEINVKLAEYTEQLEEAVAELEKYVNEVPEALKEMEAQLVEKWDKWDNAFIEGMKKDRSELEYNDYCKKYSAYDRMNTIYLTPEQVHKMNTKDANALVINLYNRVIDKTGNMTDWAYIHCTQGAYGPVLNGVVRGEKGSAVVETILAGGYNIQRLHVRTLVK